jgi:hypothetical protein
VIATGPEHAFLLAPVPPMSAIRLQIATADSAGRVTASVLVATTAAPMAHLVLNEVMANPLGPEPQQEWVEIVNDGLVAADLSGYLLGDLAGETALPAGVLPPGAYALVVNEAFVEDDEIDPEPAPGTLLLRVEKLGTNGLNNAGEPIKLRDPDGVVISKLPALPKPKAGWSLARLTPKSPDGLASSFRLVETPSPGTQNGP